MRILIFGDSIGQGYYDLEMGGWANLLFIENMKRKARKTTHKTEVFNESVSGDTIRRILDRLDAEIHARLWENDPVALIFAVGVNDAMLNNGQPISSVEKYRAELEELYSVAQKHSQHIVFVGLEAVDESEAAPWIFNTGKDELVWKNEQIRIFDETLRSFAEEKQVNFVPVFDEFIKRQAQGEKLHTDGLHPNAAGHRVIFEQVMPVFEELVAKN